MAAAIALAVQPALAQDATPRAGPPSQSTCDQPVVMVVTGLTLDRERMGEYARAIAESKIYEKLGGYYLNIPRTLEVFEGTQDPRATTITVRFPCIENARAFWYSRTYQETILPLRQDPSAGEYSVRVYPEAPLREDMVGKVGDNAFMADFPADRVPQIER
ncbi:MAG: DUF1330 domain-containing protein [Erythrobacter sp.]|nr:DUF1330 domain-containing protein [Erythrobacter sp.]